MALKGNRLVKRDFLSLADLTPDKIAELLELAISLKKKWASGGNAPYLSNKTLAMAFQKPSLRTRVSFDMAMAHLGGRAIYLAPEESLLSRGCSDFGSMGLGAGHQRAIRP